MTLRPVRWVKCPQAAGVCTLPRGIATHTHWTYSTLDYSCNIYHIQISYHIWFLLWHLCYPHPQTILLLVLIIYTHIIKYITVINKGLHSLCYSILPYFTNICITFRKSFTLWNIMPCSRRRAECFRDVILLSMAGNISVMGTLPAHNVLALLHTAGIS